MIIDKLIDKIIDYGNPTVVGLDPRLDMIPAFVREAAFEEYGQTLNGAAHAFYEFNRRIIDRIYDIVPAVKPQVAMYEQFGAEGIECYIKTTSYAKSRGMFVIGDIKRGDIASTAEAYSEGHLGRVSVGETVFNVYKSDFSTINPYLGSDSVEPFVKTCKSYEKGLFVLVKTSNPNSGEIQDIDCGGKKLYEIIAGMVAKWGEDMIGANGFSEIGAVVGATHPDQARRLRELMPNTFFLVPGYGAQGATAEDLSVCFNEKGLGAIINSSRGIIAAYKSSKYRADFPENEFDLAARQAALDMREDLSKCFRNGRVNRYKTYSFDGWRMAAGN